MPVHLYGLPADMSPAHVTRGSHGLARDRGRGTGARRRRSTDVAAGSFGVGCFSFYATKNVTSGEGGCVTTDDSMLAERLRVMRNQGMRTRYDYAMIGQNWRMTDVAAAIAIPQMEHLDEIVRVRQDNASALTALLEGNPAVTVPRVPSGRRHAWHQYTVLLDHGLDRDRVATSMSSDGVDTGVYYPGLVWDHDAYRDHPNVHRGDTPVARECASRCLSLPVHPGCAATISNAWPRASAAQFCDS